MIHPRPGSRAFVLADRPKGKQNHISISLVCLFDNIVEQEVLCGSMRTRKLRSPCIHTLSLKPPVSGRDREIWKELLVLSIGPK
jgi:hypothetical protein